MSVLVKDMKMPRKVEFIESYIKVGNDYQWNDNHGELIRCKDCKFCDMCALSDSKDGFCAWAKPKETE